MLRTMRGAMVDRPEKRARWRALRRDIQRLHMDFPWTVR